MRKFTSIFYILFCFSSIALYAQPSNDECFNPIVLKDVTDWCSKPGEFTNVGATPSTYGLPACFTNVSNDVWFAFTAVATDVVITISGKTSQNPGGTLKFPEAALYNGFCGSTLGELECQTDNGNSIIELYQAGLFVGSTYLIRVDGRVDFTGTFEICINNYNPPADPKSDCPLAAVLCDKSPFVVQSVKGAGTDTHELDDALCFSNGASLNNEMNSTWFTWKCRKSGSLTFTLTPNKINDDLDFVVYELPNGIDNCQGKKILRCMASGDNVYPSKCMGPTGLREGETDIEEPAGCGLSSQDNFLAPLQMEQGKVYALVINNFTSTGTGFSVQWDGIGEFEGPNIDFSWLPDTVKCLEPIVFTDNSSFDLGSITGWAWSFGEDAAPSNAVGEGPNKIIYNSFGQKYVTLVVTSDLGCKITKTKPVFIDVCCLPGDNFSLSLDSLVEPKCHGYADAELYFSGAGGNPWYKYSTDGINYTGASAIGGLTAGKYEVKGFDSHGCRDSFKVNINQPELLTVDAGLDQTVDLGYTAIISASTYPFNRPVALNWISNIDTSQFCKTCFNIEVLPPGTTSYVATIVDSTGCMASDDVLIFVVDKKPIYIPNAISPNGDGFNEGFTLYGGVAAKKINLLRVYSRWGSLLFETHDIDLNQPKLGWDGTFNGQIMNPGVYVFYAEVGFVDHKNVIFKGDINLLR